MRAGSEITILREVEDAQVQLQEIVKRLRKYSPRRLIGDANPVRSAAVQGETATPCSKLSATIPASEQHRDCAADLIRRTGRLFPLFAKVCADGGYQGPA